MIEPVENPPELAPVTREAIAWVVRLTSGEMTTAEASALKRWRAQSQAHEEAFKSAAKLWRGFEKAARQDTVASAAPSEWRLLHRKINPVIARRAFLGGGALAAAVTAVAIVRPPLDLWPSLTELLADYRTGKGERREIALADDVRLQLNTLTSIAVRSNQDEPRIELISGETAINANRGSAKPLVVIAADGRMSATQADFNARCIDGAVSVTCVGGEVTVERGDRAVRLAAGQQVSYSAQGLGPALAVDPAQATAWQSGLLIFRDRPLGEVIDEINRYRPGRIIITNGGMKNRMVNGTFHLDSLDNFVAQVQQLFGAKATSLPGGVTLLS